MKGFSTVKADKKQFAIYQAIYFNADLYLMYDWNARLEETAWTDECYFVLLDGKKIGGAIITGEQITYAFLIPPFSDRERFWNYLLKNFPKRKLMDILDIDLPILTMFGYKSVETYQIMVRPSEVLEISLPDGFDWRPLNMDTDAAEFGKQSADSYNGSIFYGKGYTGENNEPNTQDDEIADAFEAIGIFTHKNMSMVIVEKAGNRIVASCAAGIGKDEKGIPRKNTHLRFMSVLPEYSGRGLAKFMIGNVVSQSFGFSQFVRLRVEIGNTAERLYRQMGFIAGARHTKMFLRQ